MSTSECCVSRQLWLYCNGRQSAAAMHCAAHAEDVYALCVRVSLCLMAPLSRTPCLHAYHCHLLQCVCCLANVALCLLHRCQPACQPRPLDLNKDLQHRSHAHTQTPSANAMISKTYVWADRHVTGQCKAPKAGYSWLERLVCMSRCLSWDRFKAPPQAGQQLGASIACSGWGWQAPYWCVAP